MTRTFGFGNNYGITITQNHFYNWQFSQTIHHRININRRETLEWNMRGTCEPATVLLLTDRWLELRRAPGHSVHSGPVRGAWITCSLFNCPRIECFKILKINKLKVPDKIFLKWMWRGKWPPRSQLCSRQEYHDQDNKTGGTDTKKSTGEKWNNIITEIPNIISKNQIKIRQFK